jgi:hypothetical protein
MQFYRMDIYNYAVVIPAQQQLRQNMNFSSMKKPLDVVARAAGTRWFEASGGDILRRESKFKYSDYCAENSIPEEDTKQIEKDLSRTSGTSFSQSSICRFLGLMDQKALSAEVSRVLHAVVRRNPYPGYAQGMDYIVFMLAAFQEEDKVFWTICAIVERMLPNDYFAPPPAMMAGFTVERSVLVRLARDEFPDILAAVPPGDFELALEAVAPKWLIALFIDSVPLSAVLPLLESFFHHKGLFGVYPVVFAILRAVRPAILDGEDILVAINR